jgi:hypothetical protein
MNGNNQTTSGRLVLLTIIGLPITMILAGTWLWWFVVKGDLDLVGVLGTANNGTLVQPPRQLQDFPLAAGDELYEHDAQEPKWTFLVPVSASGCDAACEQSLYVTRQIHVAIGRDFKRIRRYLVSDAPASAIPMQLDRLSDGAPAPAELSSYLAEEHDALLPLQLPSSTLPDLAPEFSADASSWYLVDPAGWIMMSYNNQVHYKDVISDLKFLLKNSGG